MLYAEHVLSFWESGLCVPDGQRVPLASPPGKPWALGLECVSLGVKSSHALSQHAAGGIQGVPCGSTGRGLWKLQLVSQTSPHAPFVFPGLAWDPLAVINHSHEYEYGWSPSILLRIPEPGDGFADPWLSPPSSGPGSTLTSSPVTLPPRLSPDSPTLAVPSVWSAPYIQPRGLFPHPIQGSSPVSPIRKAMLGHPL